MDQKPLEKAVVYAETITSPFHVDTALLKAGATDLVARLQALEADVAALKVSK